MSAYHEYLFEEILMDKKHLNNGLYFTELIVEAQFSNG